jgi:acyl-CoA thioesterase FadM
MTNDILSVPATEVSLRPRFEGCNIGAWLGFKHLMYLMEEAVIEHFRGLGFGPRRLFQEFHTGLEIVDSRIWIRHVVHVDDVVRVQVTPQIARDHQPVFQVQAFVDSPGAAQTPRDLNVFSGQVRAVLVPEITAGEWEWPTALAPYVVSPGSPRSSSMASPSEALDEDGRGVLDAADDDLIVRLAPPDANAFVWKWRIPYFYCHYSERLQHSGYIRLLEEVVDLFLARRGLSIRTMLTSRNWIPFVQDARIEILGEALMEETIYTVYTVRDIYKNLLYAARLDCHVPRAGSLVHVARGDITHGYAKINGRSEWGLVPFDAETRSALSGGSRRPR